MQGTINDGVMNRVAKLVLIGLTHGRRPPHRTPFRFLDKGSQQILLFLDGQVGMIATTMGLVAQSRFALLQVTSLDVAHGTGLPTQDFGYLPRAQTQRGAEPDTLNPLILGLATSLLQQRR
jgi:hypothetical protein